MNRPRYQIINADILEWAAGYDGPKFHALFCDSPYHLTSITKRFGKANSAPAKFGKDGAFGRAAAGFMGMTWDGGDIAFKPETWAAMLQHLHPGAFGMTYGGSRTYHRIACAIEDAGAIIHPNIFNYVTGMGFPKATRIPDERFSGYRYGLQAMKPAVEPIIVFQKPYEGKPVDCIRATGAGALNVDKARVRQSYHNQACDASFYIPGGARALLDVACKTSLSLEFCLDSLRRISFVLQAYNTGDIDRLHSERGQGGNLPDRVLYASLYDRLYPNEVWCGVNLLSILNFLPGYQSCYHLYDELLHKIQEAAQDGAPSLGDALEHTCTALSEPSHNPYEDNALPSNEGDLVLTLSLIYLLSGTLIDDIIPQLKSPYNPNGKNKVYGKNMGGGEWSESPLGRWPSNFTLTHSPECQRAGVKRVKGDSPSDRRSSLSGYEGGWQYGDEPRTGYTDPDGYETVEDWQCVEGCPARILGEQSGNLQSGYMKPGQPRNQDGGYSGDFPDTCTLQGTYGDSGTAARFFFQAHWSYEVYEQINNANPVYYTTKTSRAEREAGLDHLPVKTRRRVNSGGLENEPRFAPTEVRNDHPTVKNISLNKYFSTLLAPPEAYAPRRILVPFAGVASEMLGALLSCQWEEIVGIELMPEYAAIAEARLAWWADRMRFGATDPDVILDSLKEQTNPDQLTFF